ncbi:hypothetical protein Eta_003 [Serratia phage Eta]|uniref:Uncharacterized protein n=1 Tax=Serratia phage Eta TaxID=1282995 RepID=R9W0V4_9CAUD|nr:hypothetical protein Eta_003 [Serratia phage Eta]AGN89449.1 hypothetical protein Eta_003 [Serratia phage Eta]
MTSDATTLLKKCSITIATSRNTSAPLHMTLPRKSQLQP